MARIDLSTANSPDYGPKDTPELFTYGTLQIEQVVTILIDRAPESRAAHARGWRVAKLPELPYPGLVPDSASTAPGRVYSDLTEKELLTLDAFENPDYFVKVVALDDGGRALAYIWPGSTASDDWTLDNLDSTALSEYLERCRRWRERHEGRSAGGEAK